MTLKARDLVQTSTTYDDQLTAVADADHAAMKKFLDRLPRILSANAPYAKRQDQQTYPRGVPSVAGKPVRKR